MVDEVEGVPVSGTDEDGKECIRERVRIHVCIEL